MTNDYVTSMIRTYVPIAVGAIVAWLAARGFNIDGNALIVVLTGVATSAYYTLVRSLERWRPSFGRLLGVSRTPKYD